MYGKNKMETSAVTINTDNLIKNFKRKNKYPLVSIIIPVFNQVQHTKRCLSSLINILSGQAAQIIIVDDGSTDETGSFLRTLPKGFTVIHNNVNSGFSKACNLGARAALGKYLVFLNNDTAALPGWLEEMIKVADGDNSVGVIGSKLLYPDGTIQHAGVLIIESANDPLLARHAFYKMPAGLPEVNKVRDYQAVTGACLLIKRGLFFEVGGFSEEYINGYEDIDLCFKVRSRGLRVVYCPTSVLYHYESSSEGRYDHVRHNTMALHKNWLGKILPDARERSETPGRRQKPVSIVLVTCNPADTIKKCIARLMETTIPGDQIIIVDNNSGDGTVKYLGWLQKARPMVKVIFNSENIGAPRAYNLGASHCTNEYVALLRPEVMVTKNWLSAIEYLNKDPAGAVGPLTNIKTEKQWYRRFLGNMKHPDKITIDLLAEMIRERNAGIAVETKLLSGICLIMPKIIIDKIGLFDTECLLDKYELELCWKLSEGGYKLLIASDAFVFLEKTGSKKNYHLTQHSINILANRLARHYAPQKCPPPEDLWGISWFKSSGSLTSIVIPCLNQVLFTRQCVESLLRHTPEPVEYVFINNGSTDETGEYLKTLSREHANVKIINNEINLGYGPACNQGIKIAGGEYVLLLNNDTVVTEGWLARMLAAGDCLKGTGLIGPRSNAVAGPQKISITYRNKREMGRQAGEMAVKYAAQGFETDCIIGFCMMIRREVIDCIGGMDPRFGYGNFEDDDICMRARIAGYKIWVCNDVFIHHYGSKTFEGAKMDHSALMAENWEKFKEKWGIPKERTLDNWYAAPEIINRPFDKSLYYCPLEISPEKRNPPPPEHTRRFEPGKNTGSVIPAFSPPGWRKRPI